MIKNFLCNNHLVFLISSISILILLLFPFYSLNYEFELYSYLFLSVCFASAYLGLKLGNLNRSNKTQIKKTSLLSYNKILLVVITISIFGLILSFYEYFFVRGLSFKLDINYSRLNWKTSNTTILSAITALTQTFSLFALPIYIQKNYHYHDKKYFLISIFILIIYLYIALVTGSRLQIISSLLIQIIFYGYYYKIKKFFIFLSFFSFIFFSGFYLNIRLLAYDTNLLDSLFFSGYVFTVSPYDDYLNLSYKSFFFYSLYSIYFYLIHGVYEFLYLIENATVYYDFGKNILWLPLKIFSIFYDFNLNSDDFYREGIFNTFAGIFFRDFKFFSPFVIFVVFYFLSYASKKLKQNDELWLLVATPISVFLLYSPIMSGFGSGPLMYYLTTSLFVRSFFYFTK